MSNIIFLFAIPIISGAILLHFSLKLEVETSGKNSKEYKSLKHVAGGGLLMSVIGFCLLTLLGLLI